MDLDKKTKQDIYIVESHYCHHYKKYKELVLSPSWLTSQRNRFQVSLVQVEFDIVGNKFMSTRVNKRD